MILEIIMIACSGILCVIGWIGEEVSKHYWREAKDCLIAALDTRRSLKPIDRNKGEAMTIRHLRNHPDAFYWDYRPGHCRVKKARFWKRFMRRMMRRILNAEAKE